MSIDVEYAIKKDIRNNPIVREVDNDQRRELMRTVLVTAAVVGMLLFSAWQHFQMRVTGYETERVRQQQAQEESAHRKLTLELEALRAPARIEEEAVGTLHMVVPTSKDTIVIQRVTPGASSKAVVAEVR